MANCLITSGTGDKMFNRGGKVCTHTGSDGPAPRNPSVKRRQTPLNATEPETPQFSRQTHVDECYVSSAFKQNNNFYNDGDVLQPGVRRRKESVCCSQIQI